MKYYEILNKLSRSKFRESFHLNDKDKKYIQEKGMALIKEHAVNFIDQRLAPSKILNDGKQTPMNGHPVFIAEHATATCCRKCLYKWHKIEQNKNLSEAEKTYIVNLIMAWIEKEIHH